MAWTVEILNDVDAAELLALPADMQAALARLAERIIAVGLERIHEPHLKHLEGRLREMRMSGGDGVRQACGGRSRICKENPEDAEIGNYAGGA